MQARVIKVSRSIRTVSFSRKLNNFITKNPWRLNFERPTSSFAIRFKRDKFETRPEILFSEWKLFSSVYDDPKLKKFRGQIRRISKSISSKAS